MPKKSIIRTEKLCKSFSSGGVMQHVIKNLDTEIYEGDFTVIMGSSGAGKSTLLYALSGMDKASLGKVYFSDRNITEFNSDQLAIFRRKHCGFVFQQVYLMDSMSVLDNVLTAGLLTGQNKRKLNANAKDLLKQVGIEPKLWNKFPNQLSGGEQQRVSIARALAKNPKLLLCDEPTGALDYQTGKAILKLLQDTCRRTKTTVVVITHNKAIAPMADRVISIKNGKVSSMRVNENPVDVSEIEW